MTIRNSTIKTVYIPSYTQRSDMYMITCNVEWVCPECGGPRRDIAKVFLYNGSVKTECDGWINPCGHIDRYQDVAEESLRDVWELDDNYKSYDAAEFWANDALKNPQTAEVVISETPGEEYPFEVWYKKMPIRVLYGLA